MGLKAADYYRSIDRNFMTPGVIEYVDLPDERMVELSVGKDFSNDPIYGVTVTLQPVGDEKPVWDQKDSGLFRSIEEARAHIEGLK